MSAEQSFVTIEQLKMHPVLNLAGVAVSGEVTYVGSQVDLYDMSLQTDTGTKGALVEKLHWLINFVAGGQHKLVPTLFEIAYGHGMNLVKPESKTGGESLVVAKQVFAQTLADQTELSGDGITYLPENPTVVLQQKFAGQPQLLAVNVYLAGLSAGIIFSANGHGQPGEITAAPTELENPTDGFELLPVSQLTHEVLTAIQANPETLISLLIPDVADIESLGQLHLVSEKLGKLLKSYLNTRIKVLVEAKKTSKTVVKMLPKGSCDPVEVKPYVFSQWSVWYEDKWAAKAKELTVEDGDSVVYPVAAQLAYLDLTKQVLVNDIKAGKIPAELAQKMVKFIGGVLPDYAKYPADSAVVVDMFAHALVEEGVGCGNGLLVAWEGINKLLAEKEVSSEEVVFLKEIAIKIIGKVNVSPDCYSIANLFASCLEGKKMGKPIAVCHFACPNYSDGSPSGLMVEGVGPGSINTLNTLVSIALSLKQLGLNAVFNIVYADDEIHEHILATAPVGSVEFSYQAFSQYAVGFFKKNNLSEPTLCCKSQLSEYQKAVEAKDKLLVAVDGGLLDTLPEVNQWIDWAVDEDFLHPLPSVAGLSKAQLNLLYTGMVGDYYAASGLIARIQPDVYIGLETNTNRLWMFTGGYGNDFPPNQFPVLNFKKGKAW